MRGTYGDDVAASFCTMEGGLEFYFESKKCLRKSGFEFRKRNSNNKELVDKFCSEEIDERSYEQGKKCLGLRKVLGINWHIEKDLFVFYFDKIIQLSKYLKYIKRKLLKINAISPIP